MQTIPPVEPAPQDLTPGSLWIGGKPCQAASEKTFDVHYPATGGLLTRCAEADGQDVEIAVAAAHKAFRGWSTTSPAVRGRLLKRLAALLEDRASELARLTTLEMGKPIREAQSVDLPHSAAVFRYFGEWADKVYGETCPVDSRFLNYTLREPLGVVAAITAWNFPLVLASWKLAPALAMGNTVILKPPEQAPLASLKLGELAAEAGFPEGVVNVLAGFGPTAGAALSAHPTVAKVAFTGEHLTAQKIVRAAAGNLKKVSVECGGKSPHIVFSDADMKGALSAVFGGIFSNQGQVCNAGSRLFLPRGGSEDFLEQLTSRVRSIRLGDPTDPSTEMGPVVSRDQFERVLGYLESGRREGAEALCGGAPSKLSEQGGYFIEPTIFAGVEPSMRIAREEIFGPVLSILAYRDDDEAVEIANDTPYGLSGYVSSGNIDRARRIAARLRTGMVHINGANLDSFAPFGGYKQSGNGREWGAHGIDEFLEVKSIYGYGT